MVIKLTNDKRPVFIIYANGTDVLAMLDTGAFMNVYTKDESLFRRRFPNAYKVKEQTLVGGFGGRDSIVCDVYLIPIVQIGSTTFHNLPIAIQPNANISTELILSSVTLRRWPFTIDYLHKELSVDKIGNDVYARYSVFSHKPDIISDFFVFTQEEYV